MALCDWCGKSERKIVEIPNGRTNLRLCPFCKAEYELKQGGAIVLPPSGPPPQTWWEKLKRYFT
jgi:hypothetical protein